MSKTGSTKMNTGKDECIPKNPEYRRSALGWMGKMSKWSDNWNSRSL